MTNTLSPPPVPISPQEVTGVCDTARQFQGWVYITVNAVSEDLATWLLEAMGNGTIKTELLMEYNRDRDGSHRRRMEGTDLRILCMGATRRIVKLNCEFAINFTGAQSDALDELEGILQGLRENNALMSILFAGKLPEPFQTIH